jgi:hypothetical protein
VKAAVAAAVLTACASSRPHTEWPSSHSARAGVYQRGFIGPGQVVAVLYDGGTIVRFERGAFWVGQLPDRDRGRIEEILQSDVFRSDIEVNVEMPGFVIDGGIDIFAVRGSGSVLVSNGLLQDPEQAEDPWEDATRAVTPPPALAMNELLRSSPLLGYHSLAVGPAIVSSRRIRDCESAVEGCHVPSWLPRQPSLIDRERVLELRPLTARCKEERPCEDVTIRYCVPGENELFSKWLRDPNARCP